MPELPDVELLRRYVEATALHQTIAEVAVVASRMLKGVSAGDLRSTLEGTSFEAARRHGKHLFVETKRGPWLVLHFGMTGSLDYAKGANDAKGEGEPPAHTRLSITFDNGYRLAGIWRRRLGEIRVVDEPEGFIEERGLGPDALSLELDAFKELLGGRGGGIKSALMDQGFIAGLGNVYTDEILFHGHLDPGRKAAELNSEELAGLHGAMLHVLRLAIERKADPSAVPDTWLLPHREPDARCPRCGGRIEKVKTGGRAGYRCPSCQS